METKIKYLFAIAIALITLSSIVNRHLLVLIPIFVVFFKATEYKTPKRSLEHSYLQIKMLNKQLSQNGSAMYALRRFSTKDNHEIRKYLLNQNIPSANANKSKEGLIDIFSAIDSLQNPKTKLLHMQTKLHSEIMRFKQVNKKIRVSEIMDFAGLAIFFPMFAGVISNIITSTIYANAILQKQFFFVIIFYCATMPFLWAALKNVGKDLANVLYDASCLCSISIFVFLSVSSYVHVLF